MSEYHWQLRVTRPNGSVVYETIFQSPTEQQPIVALADAPMPPDAVWGDQLVFTVQRLYAKPLAA